MGYIGRMERKFYFILYFIENYLFEYKISTLVNINEITAKLYTYMHIAKNYAYRYLTFSTLYQSFKSKCSNKYCI